MSLKKLSKLLSTGRDTQSQQLGHNKDQSKAERYM